MTQYILGAYAASPCLNVWSPGLEDKFYSSLRDIPLIRGLEIPFYDSLHKFDEKFLFEKLNPSWSNVVTVIPGTMDRLKVEPAFGLASDSPIGRTRALQHLKSVHRRVKALNQKMGRQAVFAVEIQSAPRRGGPATSSARSLAASLQEIAGWDWEGAVLHIEHCDAFRPDAPNEKAFLTLEEEIAAVQDAGLQKKIRFVVNWGRSAIEARDPDNPVRHIEILRKQNFLGGLIFSGCAVKDPLYGNWSDSHAPFSRSAKGKARENFLLTEERLGKCLSAAKVDSLLFTGVKMQSLPASLTVDERVDFVAHILATLDRTVALALL